MNTVVANGILSDSHITSSRRCPFHRFPYRRSALLASPKLRMSSWFSSRTRSSVGAVCFCGRSRTIAPVSNTTPLRLVFCSIAGCEAPVKVLFNTLGGDFEPTPLPPTPNPQQNPLIFVSFGADEYDEPVNVMHCTLGETGIDRSSTDSSSDLQRFTSALLVSIPCVSIPAEGLSSAAVAALAPTMNAWNLGGSLAATTVLPSEFSGGYTRCEG